MRRLPQWCAWAVMILAAVHGAQAAEPSSDAAPGRPMFQLNHGFLRPHPAATVIPSPAPQHESAHPNFHQHHDNFAVVPFYWGMPYWWNPTYTPAFGPYYPPGSVIVGGVNYSGVVLQGGAPPQTVAPAPAAPAPRAPAGSATSAKSPRTKLRESNAETKAKAGKFVGYGDANFAKQKYLPAVERYKTAAEIAPDVPEIFIREGYALVAMGRYVEAIRAYRRALGLRSDWRDSSLRLDQLYGDARVAKTAHFENLAKAIEANPLDSDLLVLLGMELFFDGQRDRSEVFFARAAQLGANDERWLNDFMPQPGPAGAPPKAAGGKVVF